MSVPGSTPRGQIPAIKNKKTGRGEEGEGRGESESIAAGTAKKSQGPGQESPARSFPTGIHGSTSRFQRTESRRQRGGSLRVFTRGRSSRSRFPGRFWPLIATSPLPLSAPAAIASLPAARGAASQPDREGLGGTADDKARAEEAAGSQRAPPGSSCPLGRPGHHADAEPRIPSRVRERVWLLLPPPPAALQRIRAAGRGIRALLVQLPRAVVGWERRGHGVTCGGVTRGPGRGHRRGCGCRAAPWGRLPPNPAHGPRAAGRRKRDRAQR